MRERAIKKYLAKGKSNDEVLEEWIQKNWHQSFDVSVCI